MYDYYEVVFKDHKMIKQTKESAKQMVEFHHNRGNYEVFFRKTPKK